MTVASVMERMIAYSEGNLHDINHFLKVWGFAKTIGEAEGLDDAARLTLELAAITHDIACPLCREKYGNTNGRHQEAEGRILAADFLRGCGVPEDTVSRVSQLVGRHHTLTGIDGADCQILIEADYLVNADEAGYAEKNIRTFRDRIFRTKTGTALLNSIYRLES